MSDFDYRSQFFLNGPKLTAKKHIPGTAAYQFSANFIEKWAKVCRSHLITIEEDFEIQGIDEPLSSDIDQLLKKKMERFSYKNSFITKSGITVWQKSSDGPLKNEIA